MVAVAAIPKASAPPEEGWAMRPPYAKSANVVLVQTVRIDFLTAIGSGLAKGPLPFS